MRPLPPLLSAIFASAVATGCTTTQVGDYWGRVDRGVSDAVARASHRLGILPQSRMMWARSAVRVRSGPGLDHAVIGALAYGESIPVVGERNGWVRVRYGRREGWVAGDYVTAVRPGGGAALAAGSGGVRTAAATDDDEEAMRSATEPSRSGAPGDTAASDDHELALPVSARGSAGAYGAGDEIPPGEVTVSGIRFAWGESRRRAMRRYADRAARIDPNGAVWLRAATVDDGVMVPAEWFDLRFCRTRLCGIHHVLNDVGRARGHVGEQAAAMLEGRYGPPSADFWTDVGYGRVRVRTWRTADSRIRLTHQEEQTYAAIDYEPPADGPAPARSPRGRLAQDSHGEQSADADADGDVDAGAQP